MHQAVINNSGTALSIVDDFVFEGRTLGKNVQRQRVISVGA